MAEQIPYAVAASLIDRLASAAFRELGRVYGVMDELKKLKSTVESIKAVLLDAEEKQEREHAVQLWITRLKDVLYPAEDLLDEFAIEDTRHKLGSAGSKKKVQEVLHSLSLNRLAFRRNMARKIEKLQNRFNDVVQEMTKLTLIPRIVVLEQTNLVRRETASFVLPSDIIGRDDSKKEIISLLMQPYKSQNTSVVAIVGIGGLGKTALAQLVYNDAEVNNVFEKRMWVCVSDNFDVKMIVRNMLVSLTKEKIDNNLPLQKLQDDLLEKLSGKKYLLVLDDTWNESYQKWTQLRKYLMCGAQGSKVLVTTRSQIVAQTMGVQVIHVLNGLTLEESWGLLKKITFEDDATQVSQSLESIGEKIAEKCRGVPLAIRTLGGLLQSKSEESEWMNVLQGDFWKLCEDEDSIIPVLKLSYQNLSPQIRQCFAYCSLYPKDLEIEKDDLIELWMAQGYLQCLYENQPMEDVGNEFVKILLMKSFFQDVKMTKQGDIKSFKMHDLMHDVAMQVAGNDCCCLDGDDIKRLEGRPMHVWVGPNAVDLLGSLDERRVRTLILGDFELNEKEYYVVSNFKYLRALRVNPSFRKAFDLFRKLKHLRYISLFQAEGDTIPKAVSNLVYLQTLRFNDGSQIEFPKSVVSKLINFRHLRMNGVDFSKPWLSSLTNVVEISLVDCKQGRISSLERLPFLKSLKIEGMRQLWYMYFAEGGTGTFFPSLERLTFRKCDMLRGWRSVGDDRSGTKYSHHLSFPRLSHLSIYDCNWLFSLPTFPKLDKSLALSSCHEKLLKATLLNIEAVDFTPLSMLKSLSIPGLLMKKMALPMDWMKNLTSLQNLELERFSEETFHEMEICFKDDSHCFPSLKKVVMIEPDGLEALPDWICNLSSLQHFTIQCAYRFLYLPEGMPRLTNLKTLEIIARPPLIEEYKNETSAARHTIAHIPNIILKQRGSKRPGRGCGMKYGSTALIDHFPFE